MVLCHVVNVDVKLTKCFVFDIYEYKMQSQHKTQNSYFTQQYKRNDVIQNRMFLFDLAYL